MAEFSVNDSCSLAVSIDTMVAGVHFHDTMPAADVGFKLMAVNLSDLAAMGAQPLACDIIRGYPPHLQEWIEHFDSAIADVLDVYGIAEFELHSNMGPLCVTVQIYGEVHPDAALLRGGAGVGDVILVTGTLGDAACALPNALRGKATMTDDEKYLMQRLCRPTPRVAVGMAIRSLATAAIDISDGLLADVGHLLKASGAGGVIDKTALPLSDALRNTVALQTAMDYACVGGDDYELCFTCATANVQAACDRARSLGVRCTPIGHVVAGTGLRFSDGEVITQRTGYDHFL